jgi:cell division protein FtsN
VLYKPSFFGGVQVYGRYETRFQAENAARRLEWNGYQTRIERFRDTGWYGW